MSPGQGITWRNRQKKDKPLPALDTPHTLVPSTWRCHAVSLLRGDCQMTRLDGSLYCYYHDKLATGLAEPHMDLVTVEHETFDNKTGKRKVRKEREYRVRTDCYPAWPLPSKGYVVLIPEAALTNAA